MIKYGNKRNLCIFNEYRSGDLICPCFVRESERQENDLCSGELHTLGIVSEGEGVLETEGEGYPLRRGTVFAVSRGRPCSVKGDGALCYYYIRYRGRPGDEYAHRLGLNRSAQVFEGMDSLLPLWEAGSAMAEEKNIDLVSEGVLLFSLGAICPANAEQSDGTVERVVLMTQESFRDPELSIGTVAAQIGYAPKYLSSLFKKQKGIAYTCYLREQRLRHAVFLMEEGLVSVKNVALLSGFHDPLYFSKVFRKAYGKTPREYMKELQRQRSRTEERRNDSAETEQSNRTKREEI